jgi:hypothetical protein
VGQSPNRRAAIDNVISSTWLPWIEREAALREELGYLVVASAGNDDTYALSFYDQCHPWKNMDRVVSVGSVDRRGLATEWSSDGTKLVGVACGERRWLMEPCGELGARGRHLVLLSRRRGLVPEPDWARADSAGVRQLQGVVA